MWRRSPPPAKAGDAFFQQYEAKLERAKLMATIVNVMYGLNWFLGFCALTWASAVILGGLLTSLTQQDYYSVVALLLLEAVRLSTVTFFGKFVTLKLVRGSADPQRLVYNDARRQTLQGIARILEQAVQLIVIAISILVPFRRLEDFNLPQGVNFLQDLNSLAAKTLRTILMNKFDGLQTSLCIFYVIVLVNGFIAALAVIFSKNVVPFFVDSFSLRKYYEKIVWKGMDEGLLHATDFELLSWTFQVQADEYRRNTRAIVVKELYGDMMKFLYYHPRHKGFEAAKVALESDDTFEREAAANIVGLWVSLVTEVEESGNNSASLLANLRRLPDKRALARLLIQERLLAKLAEIVDGDESGRAATSSFEKLGKVDPEGVLMVRSEEKDEKVVDILMDRIHRAVQLGKPNNALVYIKAMIPLLSHLIKSHELHKLMCGEEMTARNGHGKGKEKLENLKKDMWTIVSEYASGLKRTQAVAAKMYGLVASEDERKGKGKELLTHLRVKPTAGKQKQHILEEEQKYLVELGLEESLLKIEWKDVLEVRPIEEKKPLPWLARPITALIATPITLIILGVSSFYIMSRTPTWWNFKANVPLSGTWLLATGLGLLVKVLPYGGRALGSIPVIVLPKCHHQLIGVVHREVDKGGEDVYGCLRPPTKIKKKA